jgi:hypothetical protein
MGSFAVGLEIETERFRKLVSMKFMAAHFSWLYSAFYFIFSAWLSFLTERHLEINEEMGIQVRAIWWGDCVLLIFEILGNSTVGAAVKLIKYSVLWTVLKAMLAPS